MAFAATSPARSFSPYNNSSSNLGLGIAIGAAKIALHSDDYRPRLQAFRSHHTSPHANNEELLVGAFCPLYSSFNSVNVRRFSARGLMASMAMDRSNGAPNCDIDSISGVADEGGCRKGEVLRVTKETQVSITIWLDGTGQCDCTTGIPFLDHMLDVSRPQHM